MKLACPHCGRTLQFSGDCPSFCAYCGQPLSNPSLSGTADFQPPAEEATQTQAPVTAATAEPVPEAVGNYRLLRPLGSGGMGSVYEAEDGTSGRRVAVKLVSADHRVSPETLERFRQEGRLASAIAHPRCVFVLAADEQAGRPYIVMELMPGTTLNDLVGKNGPLPVEDAVRKILDVIEGLQEAHRLGVIHRDVKPSNCFVAEDGRVKVGDFGLAKSLSGGAHLTKTGSFLGTPLFASPEQIRNDPLNEQTDVYSVAATLYFLLTGRAPFQGRDATATLARIVADPVPPMQTLRPEIPANLDKVVLKGLERNRERRYRDLEALRQALLPFLTEQVSIAGRGLRFGAYWIDGIIFTVIVTPPTVYLALKALPRAGLLTQVVISWAHVFLLALYFVVLERVWGCSLGKWFMDLRVCRVHGREPPPLRAILLRTAVFILLINLGDRVDEFMRLFGSSIFKSDVVHLGNLFLFLFLILLGWLLLLAPMRARNGYRGLHEWASGTRVVRLRSPKPRRRLRARLPDQAAPDLFQPVGLPERVGSFVVRGAIAWGPESGVLLGEDPGLRRPVWIWLRPLAAEPLSAVRQQTDRGTRLRWLAEGKEADRQWDAFLAPGGTSVVNLVADGSLTWGEVRPLFEELTDELAASERDGTMPNPLGVDQVWIQPSGRLQLLDMSIAQRPQAPPVSVEVPAARGLRLLHEFAALTLEGRPRPAGEGTAQVCAPLPEHAADLLGRLRADGQPFEDLEQVQTALRQTQNRPTELTRSRRFQHLIASTILHGFAFAFLVPLMGLFGTGFGGWGGFVFLAGFTVLSAAWAFLTRGGVSLPISKVLLVDGAGRKAPRWRCAARAAVFWIPWMALVGLSDVVERGADASGLGWLAPVLAVALPLFLFGLAVVYILVALWSPARSFHDRLAGTFLVPR